MKKYIASVSWGKDSTAMLLFIIKNNMPLDEVVFYNAKHKLLRYAFADEFERIEIEQDGKLTQVII